MKIIEPGHIYELTQLDTRPAYRLDADIPCSPEVALALSRLVFVNREPGHQHPGTQVQEVLRALIDRTYHCDACLPHELNALIVHHLRMALVYHEARALERKAEKGLYEPEKVVTGEDGHFSLLFHTGASNEAPRREFQLKVPQKKCTHREY